MTSIWLAVGSTSLTDAVNLMAATVGAPRCFVLEGGFSLEPLDPAKRQRTRALALELFLDAPTSDAYRATVRAIRRKLEQAKRSLGQGDQWTGTPVSLWMQLGGATTTVYWDVDSGILAQKSDDFVGDTGGRYTLTLNVLPYARGAPVTVATSATLTNGNAGLYVPNVAGDTDALCRLTLTDVSTGGVVINRVRLGRRSLPGMGSSDFTPVVLATTPGETLPTAYVLVVGSPTAGSYTLTFGGQTTGAIAYNATASAVQTAFTGLSSVGTGNATVSGIGTAANPFIITFTGTRAATQQGTVTGTPSLTGGAWSLTRLAAASFTDATALGGSTQRLTATNGFRSLGMVSSPAGALEAGRYDVWARVRDATGNLVGKPTITSVSSGAVGDGTLNNANLTFQISEIDASGLESLPSDPVSITMPGTSASATVNFTGSGSPSSIRLYMKQDGLAWKYFGLPYSSPTTVTSNTGGTTANPPTSATTVAGVQLLPLIAVNATAPSYVLGPAVATTLGNSRWEVVRLGTFPLPPLPEWEDQTQAALAWQLLVQAQIATSTTAPPTIDFDGVWLMPHEEPQYLAEVSALNLATARTWVIDTRRDGRSSAILTDGSGTPQSQASKRAAFTLGPGNNLVIAEVDIAGGLSDVVNAKYTVGIQYVPRWEFPVGIVWS